MSSTTITALTTASGIDGAVDWLAIDRTSLGATQKINRQTFLGVTGQPMDISSSQNVTNKTLDNTNTVTLKDTLFTLQDDSDTTKQARFQLSGITTATTRTYTLPNASSTLVDIATTQTLAGKTLTAPVINNGSITGTTITTDAIVGQSVSTSGTIYGLSVSSGKVGTNGVITASLTANSVTTAKLATGVNFQPSTVEQVPYKFSVYRNAALNAGNATFALATFDTVLFDTGSNYSTSTGKFTAPIAGFYQFSWQLGTSGTTTRLIASIAKNSVTTELHRGSDITTSAAVAASSGSALIQMAANDTANILSFSASGATALAVGTSAQCYFTGFLRCAT